MTYHSPKYWKEMARLRKEHEAQLQRQAASSKLRYTPTGILLGVNLGDKPQASSSKHQAPSFSKKERQASSSKHKGSSSKPQASSS